MKLIEGMYFDVLLVKQQLTPLIHYIAQCFHGAFRPIRLPNLAIFWKIADKVPLNK